MVLAYAKLGVSPRVMLLAQPRYSMSTGTNILYVKFILSTNINAGYEGRKETSGKNAFILVCLKD